MSDRNAKQDLVSVNPRQVLNQVVALPIAKWAYKDDATQTQHIGPMAQDFYAAFNVGADDKHINPVDSEGVALAAIQGLSQVVQDKDAKISEQQKQIDSLDARLAVLELQSSSPISLNTLVVGALIFGAFVVGRRWNKQ